VRHVDVEGGFGVSILGKARNRSRAVALTKVVEAHGKGKRDADSRADNGASARRKAR
jgi:hypothetical protein